MQFCRRVLPLLDFTNQTTQFKRIFQYMTIFRGVILAQFERKRNMKMEFLMYWSPSNFAGLIFALPFLVSPFNKLRPKIPRLFAGLTFLMSRGEPFEPYKFCSVLLCSKKSLNPSDLLSERDEPSFHRKK